jgi:hypothetical protein
MMLTILEKYFLEHGQLVLPGIGNLRMHQTDAIQMNGQFQPPVHQIVFDAIIEPSTKPNKLFYIYLSEHLDCTIEQAIIDYAAFFTNQLAVSNIVDLGNLGHLNIQNETYTFESNYNSAHYFQPVQLEKVQIEDQTENNFNTSYKQWWILPLIIATIAIVAILLK